ncbi:MAG: type I methionyl aminopeptidase [Gemmatimonadetes bacterium]|nr:type I methionyl aminopeptidase [Gemmatimonadota bacterium]
MIQLKSPKEIEAIARAGEIVGELLRALEEEVVPGVTTAELDTFAEAFIRRRPGAAPAFKGLYGFPATLCTSLNEEVVHGIPSRTRVLEEGDILKIDVGVYLDAWYADAAMTYPVGGIVPETRRLLTVTQEALRRGIEAAVPGNRIGDIGAAIQETAEKAGFSVVRELVGHGVGREPHEEPQVPNVGRAGQGPLLREGMVLAIEPMINAGTFRVSTLEDRWTVVTADRSLSAHYEHTVAVTAPEPRILTRVVERAVRRSVVSG